MGIEPGVVVRVVEEMRQSGHIDSLYISKLSNTPGEMLPAFNQSSRDDAGLDCLLFLGTYILPERIN